jgi:hypothetical protein
MSEYQYYEFRAIDRPLNDQQMQELRAISTRAAISRTSFSRDHASVSTACATAIAWPDANGWRIASTRAVDS